MGMAAGQARLLSITARLTDNENTGQALSYSKQRLADQTEQITSEYNAALGATKLTVLTGFNGSDAQYEDISYGLMTGYNTVACGKQYVISNIKGQILVEQKYANAFKDHNGDFNGFLLEVGPVINGTQIPYVQCDIDLTDKDTAEQKVHEAWDKYFKSVGKSFYDEEHENENANIEFDFTYMENKPKGWRSGDPIPGPKNAFDGYVTYSKKTTDASGNEIVVNSPINYEGTTKEQRELYDYALALTVALTESELSSTDPYYAAKNLDVGRYASDPDNAAYIEYLRNIFDQMSQFGFYTEADETKTIKDNSWFEDQLKQGKLFLKSFSATEKTFISTSLSDDDAIQEVEDERKIAMLEAKYNQDLAALEKKDERIDLELKKLDTEHNALQTEYESVKNVIDKNVQKSFSTFS